MEINSLTRKTLFHLRYLRLLVVLLCISCNLIMLVVPIYIGKAIDSLNGHNNAKSFWIILLLFVIGAVFNYFQNFLWFKLTHLGKAALRGEVFKRIMEKDIVARLREFMENEARSCSMDFGCVTLEYVHRMWGGSVPLEEIKKAMAALKS